MIVDRYLRFRRLRKQFPALYDMLRTYDVSQFVAPLWSEYNRALEAALLPYPPFLFLRNPVIRQTMFMEKKKVTRREKEFLKTDYGNSNATHHAYHLARWRAHTHVDLDSIGTVVEWGGGYGNFAYMVQQWSARQRTYVILDTPLVSCLQWLHLSTVLGEQNVHIITSREETIRPNMINVMPICFLDAIDLCADLFVSTWALSESSPFAQDYVEAHAWFGARHLLLAFQESNSAIPDAGRMREKALRAGATIVPLEVIRNSFYAFR